MYNACFYSMDISRNYFKRHKTYWGEIKKTMTYQRITGNESPSPFLKLYFHKLNKMFRGKNAGRTGK
tara:strand:+ start:143 stop:343 length:201 start_codon:yes stop_codon:yes gene_type:complete